MIMKYKVTIRYTDFLFDSGDEALAFAEMAKEHYLPDDDRDACEIAIYLVSEARDND